jgi:hypothetical protein
MPSCLDPELWSAAIENARGRKAPSVWPGSPGRARRRSNSRPSAPRAGFGRCGHGLPRKVLRGSGSQGAPAIPQAGARPWPARARARDAAPTPRAGADRGAATFRSGRGCRVSLSWRVRQGHPSRWVTVPGRTLPLEVYSPVSNDIPSACASLPSISLSLSP